jgi:hypothetical protein
MQQGGDMEARLEEEKGEEEKRVTLLLHLYCFAGELLNDLWSSFDKRSQTKTGRESVGE